MVSLDRLEEIRKEIEQRFGKVDWIVPKMGGRSIAQFAKFLPEGTTSDLLEAPFILPDGREGNVLVDGQGQYKLLNEEAWTTTLKE